MITIFEHAVLAGHVYNPGWKAQSGVPIYETNHKKSPDPSKKDGWYRVTDVEKTMSAKTGWRDSMSPQHPFYAQLYLKFKDGQAVHGVVAFRGTVYSGLSNKVFDAVNLFIDFDTWVDAVVYGSDIPISMPWFLPYGHLAFHFFHRAKKYCKIYFPELRFGRLHATGHSLGGALAALIPARYGIAARTVIFNAPGVGTMPEVKAKLGAWVTQVEARYDFVSKIGKPIAKHCYKLDVPDDEAMAKRAFEKFHEAYELEAQVDTMETQPSSLSSAPERQAKSVLAEKALPNLSSVFDLQAEKVLADKSSEYTQYVKAGFEEAKVALMAQHKMANLMTALRKSPIAFRTVV